MGAAARPALASWHGDMEIEIDKIYTKDNDFVIGNVNLR